MVGFDAIAVGSDFGAAVAGSRLAEKDATMIAGAIIVHRTLTIMAQALNRMEATLP